MKKTVLVQNSGERLEVYVLEDKFLVSAYSESNAAKEICGNIYLGRVTNIVKGMQAAFVDIGLERTAFLSGADNLPGGSIANVKVGMELPVQIVKLPGGDKGPLVTASIKLSGRFCVLMPYSPSVAVSKKIEDEAENARLREICASIVPDGMGLIIRTNAEGVSQNELQEDLDELISSWQDILTKAQHIKAPALIKSDSLLYKTARDIIDTQTCQVWVSDAETLRCLQGYCTNSEMASKLKLHTGDIPLCTIYSVNTQLDRALSRKVWLKSGGFLMYDTTEALHVIDVNSGKFVGSKDIEDTVLALNLEACEEIARQVRLRDIGGIIIIDFIDMKSAVNREKLLDKLRNEFKADGSRTNVIDITPLGLCEVSRKKRSSGLKAFFETEK